MRIESLLGLLSAKLCNNPQIAAVHDIHVDAYKVKRGDLFVDIYDEKSQRNMALANGAYAIISSSDMPLDDEEVAHIYTDDINLALLKLSRYFASTKNLHFVQVSPLQYEMLQCINSSLKLQAISNNPANALMEIYKAQHETVFISTNNAILNAIDPTFTHISCSSDEHSILKAGIFLTSFIFGQAVFKDLRLCAFMLRYLSPLLEYFQKHKIEFKLESFEALNSLRIQFINSKFEKKEFGSSPKALLFTPHKQIFLETQNFLLKQVSKDDVVFISHEKDTKNIVNQEGVYHIQSACELLNYKDKSFRYMLIFGDAIEFDAIYITKSQKQLELF